MKKRIISVMLMVLLCISIVGTESFAASYTNRKVVSNSDSKVLSTSMSAYSAKQRWGEVVKSYVYSNGDGTFSILDATNGKIYVKKYKVDTLKPVSTKEIYGELDLFGGFYSGSKYNYIAYGQDNSGEDNSKTVIKVVKYDKKFNKISSFSLKDCYTIEPFRAGSLRMDEYDKELTVHTSRLRYKTEDGLNHQSQLTFTINTSTMTLITSNVGRFQSNHVSHSFNQFVKYDTNGEGILVDHGDAYPRSIVLSQKKASKNGTHYDYVDSTELFKIPGVTGANCTGVTLGGLEISKNNYLVTINTIDHSKAVDYDSYEIYGLEKDERDVVVLVQPKSGGSTKKVYLTDYVGKGKLASTPYIVAIGGNRFAVMWEQYEYYTTNYGSMSTKEKGLRYVYIDENGNMLSDVQSMPDMRLSRTCQPVCIDGKIIWYVNANGKTNVYSIKVNGDPIKQAVYTDIVARINGHDIASFNVNGYTCVVAEDLWNYGFDIAWDSKTRSLKVDRYSGKKIVSNYVASTIKSDKIGKKSFDILYTDIKTYIDGKEVTSYNIDGKTLVYFNDLDEFGKITYSNSKRRIELKVDGLK